MCVCVWKYVCVCVCWGGVYMSVCVHVYTRVWILTTRDLVWDTHLRMCFLFPLQPSDLLTGNASGYTRLPRAPSHVSISSHCWEGAGTMSQGNYQILFSLPQLTSGLIG